MTAPEGRRRWGFAHPRETSRLGEVAEFIDKRGSQAVQSERVFKDLLIDDPTLEDQVRLEMIREVDLLGERPLIPGRDHRYGLVEFRFTRCANLAFPAIEIEARPMQSTVLRPITPGTFDLHLGNKAARNRASAESRPGRMTPPW
jgi:hypothetical protein